MLVSLGLVAAVQVVIGILLLLRDDDARIEVQPGAQGDPDGASCGSRSVCRAHCDHARHEQQMIEA